MTHDVSRRSWLAGSAAVGTSLVLTPELARGADLSPIKIGSVPREPACQCFYAQDAGFFQKRGLSVEITMMSNGAAIGAAVAGGALQVGNSNVLAIAQAHQHNVPLVLLTPGGIHDYRFPNSALVVAPNAPISSPKDLNGKVLGGASIGGYDQLCASMLIDKNGGDSTTVRFVELPQTAMADALATGRIAGATMSDPELSSARAAGKVRALDDAESAVAKVSLQTGWITTADWLAANKATALLFSAAIFDAGKWAMSHPQDAAKILRARTGMTEELARQRFATSFDASILQPVLDAAVKYKMLQGPIAAGDIAWNGK